MDQSEFYFKEEQQFTQPLLWIVIIGASAMVAWFDISYWMLDNPIREDVVSSTGLIILTIIMLAVFITFWLFNLITKVGKKGLYYRFYPIHGSDRFVPWEEIELLKVRTYSAMKEYQGWGLRYSLTGEGWAYNVKGNKGLQIVKKDGTRVLLGTQRPKELEQILRRLQGKLVQ